MPDFAEDQLRKIYGYPEEMTYDQYAESERAKAFTLIQEGKGEEAFAILKKLTDSIKGDTIACETLGDIFKDGKAVEKNPWKAMLYYVAAFSEKGDSMSRIIWDSLQGFRTVLLNSRPLGRFELNEHDAEYACCENMRQNLIAGNVSMSEISDNIFDCEFSMTMKKSDFKQYIGKEKHEVMANPDKTLVTPMDLRKCPFCGTPLVFRKDISDEWKRFIENSF